MITAFTPGNATALRSSMRSNARVCVGAAQDVAVEQPGDLKVGSKVERGPSPCQHRRDEWDAYRPLCILRLHVFASLMPTAACWTARTILS